MACDDSAAHRAARDEVSRHSSLAGKVTEEAAWIGQRRLPADGRTCAKSRSIRRRAEILRQLSLLRHSCGEMFAAAKVSAATAAWRHRKRRFKSRGRSPRPRRRRKSSRTGRRRWPKPRAGPAGGRKRPTIAFIRNRRPDVKAAIDRPVAVAPRKKGAPNAAVVISRGARAAACFAEISVSCCERSRLHPPLELSRWACRGNFRSRVCAIAPIVRDPTFRS